MATILTFPSNPTGMAKIRSQIEAALEPHDPSTRKRKIEAVVDVIERYSKVYSIPVTLENPEGEQFTPAQADAVLKALTPVREYIATQLQSAILEIIALKIAVIDLESL